MNETYEAMRKRHQNEINSFPCFFAFNKQQLEEGKRSLGVKSDHELYSGFGGMIYRRKDAPKLRDMLNRHSTELQNALRTDDDFLYKAVRIELSNHEYCVSGDWDEPLGALGLDFEEVCQDERLRRICAKAEKDYMESHERWLNRDTEDE